MPVSLPHSEVILDTFPRILRGTGWVLPLSGGAVFAGEKIEKIKLMKRTMKTWL